MDESSSISWLETTKLVHRRLMLVIKSFVGRTALNDDISFVELNADNTVNGALASGDRGSDELTLWGEEVTVVEDLR